MTRRSLLTTLLALATALAAASAAEATTFCVNDPACVGTQVASPQEALDMAALNNADDTVRIGAKATPYGGGLSYTDSEKISILGAGNQATVFQSGPSDPIQLSGNSSSRVQDVGVRYGDDDSVGMVLGAVADGLRITHTGSGFDTEGVRLLDGGLFDDGIVTTSGRGVVSHATTGATLRGSIVFAPVAASLPLSDSHLFVSRASLRSSRVAAEASSGHLTIDDSVLQVGTGAGASGIYALSGGSVVASHLTIVGSGVGRGVLVDASGGASSASVTVANSIITGFSQSVYRHSAAAQADLTVRWSSLDVSTAGSLGAGTLDTSIGNTGAAPEFVLPDSLVPNLRLRAPSPLIDAADPGSAVIGDRDGLPRKVDGDGLDGARADMGAYEYQRQAPTAAFDGPATAVAEEQTAFSGLPSTDPDPGEDARLSYLWEFGDGGQASGPSASHSYVAAGTYDITLTVSDPAGATHSVTKQLVVAAAAPGDGGGGGGAGTPDGGGTGASAGGDTLAPAITGLRRRGARIRFRLSETARVTLRIRPKRGGRVRVLRLAGRPGLNRVRLGRRLAAGRYVLRASARDEAGNRSAALLLRFRVLP